MQSIYDTFQASVSAHADRPALSSKRGGQYVPTTYAQLDCAARTVSAALARRGIARGDRVGILSANRPEWVIADLAVHRLGGVVVPIYPTLAPDAVAYVVRDSGLKLLFVGEADLLAKVASIRDGAWALEHLVAFDDAVDPALAEPFSALLAEEPDGASTDVAPSDVAPSDVATIVYTSGTTGEPKGVVLTHANIVSNGAALTKRFGVGPDDVYLSYLPLSHMFERTCGYYAMLFGGATIAYAEGVQTVVPDAEAIRPTIILTVPRAVEKAYETVIDRVAKGSKVGQALVARALSDLNRRANHRYRGQPVPLGLRLRCAFHDAVVSPKFRRIGGGRLRLIVSGGAPLDRTVAKILHVFGIPIVEGYGLTETSPVVSACTPDDNCLGSVGRPLADVEVRIGDADEILVRGPNVMQGYLDKDAATAQALDAEGWFHTGDCGRLDEQGRLHITGRIKDLIVTSYGKKVARHPIEADLTKGRCVHLAVLCGDNRKYVTALLVPDREAVERYAAEHGVGADGYEDLLGHATVRGIFDAEVERVNATRSRYERIRAYALLPEIPTIDNGLLTPTLKLRREVLITRHEVDVEMLYADASPEER